MNPSRASLPAHEHTKPRHRRMQTANSHYIRHAHISHAQNERFTICRTIYVPHIMSEFCVSPINVRDLATQALVVIFRHSALYSQLKQTRLGDSQCGMVAQESAHSVANHRTRECLRLDADLYRCPGISQRATAEIQRVQCSNVIASHKETKTLIINAPKSEMGMSRNHRVWCINAQS